MKDDNDDLKYVSRKPPNFVKVLDYLVLSIEFLTIYIHETYMILM